MKNEMKAKKPLTFLDKKPPNLSPNKTPIGLNLALIRQSIYNSNFISILPYSILSA